MSYADRFDVVATKIQGNIDGLVKNVIETVGTNVVTATPIDTGQARRNWQAAANTTPSSTLDAPESPSDGQQESIAVIQSVAAAYKTGDEVHITNNVPYINELNNGTSAQAPANFVEIALLQSTRLIKNVKVTS